MSIYDTSNFDKVADLEAALNYISALSKKYGQRISVFVWPPSNGKERFLSAEIGSGNSDSCISIKGDEGDMTIRWTDKDGNRIIEKFIEGKTVEDL